MSQIKPTLTHLCQQEAQTELVMLILLRLAEDVITFQTLPQQRRRDIQQTLTQNMDSIFSFMMAILRIYVEDHRKVVSGVLHLKAAFTSNLPLRGHQCCAACEHKIFSPLFCCSDSLKTCFFLLLFSHAEECARA